MIEVLTQKLSKLCNLTKDKWSVEFRQGGGGFIRNQYAPEEDRYFTDPDECFSIIQQEIDRYEK